MVCRLPEVGKDNKSLDVIQSVVDEEVGPQNTGEDLYACVWTKNLATGDPLLCVAGELGKVKIINALTGELHQVTMYPHFCSRDMAHRNRHWQVMEG